MLRTAFTLFALLLSALVAVAQPSLVRELGSNRFRYPGAITSVVGSPDGQRLAVCGSSGAWVYDFATGRPVWRSPAVRGGFPEAFTAGFAADGRLLVVEVDFENNVFARHYDLRSPLPVLSVAIKIEHFNDCTLSPDGTLLAVTEGKQVTILDACTGREVNRIPMWQRERGGLSSTHFAPDGRTLAMEAADNTFRVLERTTGRDVGYLEPRKPTRNFSFAPDGHRFTLLQEDNTFLSLDLRTGKRTKWKPKLICDQVLGLPNDEVMGVELSEMQFHTFNATTGQRVRTFRGPSDVVEVSLTPDGRTLIVPGNRGQITLWDAATGRKLPQSADDGGYKTYRFHDRDGLSGLSDRGWTRWNLTSGSLREVREWTSDFFSVLSPDGQKLATERGGEVIVTNSSTDKVTHRLRLPVQDPVRSIWFKDHGRQVGIELLDKVWVWDLTTNRVRHLAIPMASRVEQTTVHSEGRWFAAWMDRQTDDNKPVRLRLFDLDNRLPTHDLNLPNSAAGEIRFTDDGSRLVRAVPNGEHLQSMSVELFDPATGRCTRRFAGAFVDLLDISPDGRVLLTRTYDDLDSEVVTLRGVEVATGRVRWELPPIREWSLDGTGFAPDLRRLAVGTSDGIVRVWNTDGAADAAAPDWKTWDALADPDGAKGFAAIRTLARFPQVSLPLLRAKLPPDGPLDAAAVDGWLRDLDSPQFRVRVAATKHLAGVVPRARAAMEAVQSKTPSPEVRERLTDLLESATCPRPADVRTTRAVGVVERILTDRDVTSETRRTAVELLRSWANGAEGATLTTEAKETLNRVKR